MDFLVIGIVAFTATILTFFSGFGLGTILLPAFALFFPASSAVLATGIVHLLANLFKGTLVRKFVDWPTVYQFGMPAIPAAILGALLLTHTNERSLATLIGIVLIIFAILELQSWFQRLTFPRKLMPLGGILTGFIGGLTGQQGVLRSMFLLKSNFTPQTFVSTGIFIAILIDLVRIPTYLIGIRDSAAVTRHEVMLVAGGVICAFLGAYLGAKYLPKTKIGFVRYLIAGLMISIGSLLVLGIIGT
jgi:uncharacterized membrane protein YfcA